MSDSCDYRIPCNLIYDRKKTGVQKTKQRGGQQKQAGGKGPGARQSQKPQKIDSVKDRPRAQHGLLAMDCTKRCRIRSRVNRSGGNWPGEENRVRFQKED